MIVKKFKLFTESVNKDYYTTSKPMNIETFIEIEVEERDNYSLEEVKKWIEKYNITNDTLLLWVTDKPYVAASYQMPSEDYCNAEEIYNSNPDDYDVQTIPQSTIIDIIEESDDGDFGYLAILSTYDWDW